MKILLVESDRDLRSEIQIQLEKSACAVETAGTLREARHRLAFFAYDLVILEPKMPDGNGLLLLAQLKKDSPATGVMILAGGSSLAERLNCLDSGADDFLPKPCHFAELQARLRSIFRRRFLGGKVEFQIGPLTLHPESLEAVVDERTLPLTPTEFQLLMYFARNQHRVITKMDIAERICGEEIDRLDDFNFIYNHIKNLRKKIVHAGVSDPIQTIYGMGYKFSAA